ncbi:MAG TPA: DUF2628 domain-containing protein [Beijerinckiaceae bacterium]|nr:DUF2628 domain-containing protein [Beijerinckiaceae bacterium]
MKTYTLHVPRDAFPGDAEALEKAVLVRDGFVWPAFFFNFIWFFYFRLWLSGLLVLVLTIALWAGLIALGVRPAAVLLSHVLFSILIGLEANSLRRWTLSRRGRPAVDVVAASDLVDAETKIFSRWLQGTGPGPAAARPRTGYRPADPVLGLFPEAERRR